MKQCARIIVIAAVALTGGPAGLDRGGSPHDREATVASRNLPRTPQTDGSVAARFQNDIAALETFRPGYRFWRHIYAIPDGHIAFGSAVDGRLLAVFPESGDWKTRAKWAAPSLAHLLDGRELPRHLEDRREYVARLLDDEVGPVLHNSTRGRFVSRAYAGFLAEWGAIYERFGVPAEVGLAQAIVESGLEGTRRSEAGAVGLCQWLGSNWKHLDRLAAAVIESGNQTTQAAYCAAYISALATKYGTFIPALSAHHAGGTNVGRVLVSGSRLGGGNSRERYFLGAELARDLRSIGEQYSDIYESYGPRSFRYAEMVFGNAFTVRALAAATRQVRVFAMRTARPIPVAEIASRTGLTPEVVRLFNPALVKSVPAGATLYLPEFEADFGRDVSFWHRPAPAEYALVLDDFVRIGASPEEWDDPSFEPTLRAFERRFRATGTEEGAIMATVLAYVRLESMASPRRKILADFAHSEEILALFAQGLHQLDTAGVVVAAE